MNEPKNEECPSCTSDTPGDQTNPIDSKSTLASPTDSVKENQEMQRADVSCSPGGREDERLALLLDEVCEFVRRYVVVSEAQQVAIALFVAHTHAFAAADTTPYLRISSAESQSGKTRLLETLELIVAKPWFTGRMSISSLARRIEAEQPTLLLDESDALFGSDRSYVQDLRGILNSGFRRGGRHTINVPLGQNGWGPTDFSVFCPKAIAGIGDLPDTLASRSIPIRLQRRHASERVDRFRRRRVTVLAAPIREQLAQVLPECLDALLSIIESDPAMPEGLSDRAEDLWEPLFALADHAGQNWPERAREAAIELFESSGDHGISIGVRLLQDIRTVFEDQQRDQLSSTDLVFLLQKIEDGPWATWGHGRGLTTHGLARLLKEFPITPRHLRDGSARGYTRSD